MPESQIFSKDTLIPISLAISIIGLSSLILVKFTELNTSFTYHVGDDNLHGSRFSRVESRIDALENNFNKQDKILNQINFRLEALIEKQKK